MNRDRTIPALQELGLEYNEAVIYYHLVRLGPSEVGKISTYCEFSRTKIYSTIDKLLSKGWIRKISDKPKKFAPLDPGIIIDSRVETILKAQKTAKKDLYPLYESSKPDISETINYRGIRAIKKAEEMIGSANMEICIITSIGARDGTDSIIESLKKAGKRGVKIKAVVSNQLNRKLPGQKIENFLIKYEDISNGGMLIIDDNELFFGGIDTNDQVTSLENVLGIWTKNKAIIKMTKMVFDQYYSK